MADLIKQRSSSGISLSSSMLGKPSTPNLTTFNKLSDFTNLYLQKNSNPLTDGLLGKGLSIPALIPTQNNDAPLNSLGISPKLSSSPGAFNIPKLTSSPTFGSVNLSTIKAELTPHEISLRKIMDLKKIHITEQPQETNITLSPTVEQVIDLSTALRTDSKIPINDDTELVSTDEPFVPMYIDCDLVSQTTNDKLHLLPNITQDCEIDISHLVNVKLPTARVISKFGKILCSKYRCKNVSYIRHGFTPKNSIKQFMFGQPSPDDIVLRQIQKWK